jgi:hypothetical protein
MNRKDPACEFDLFVTYTQTVPGCEEISAVTSTTKPNLTIHDFATMEQTNDSHDQFEHAQAAHMHTDGACCSHCEHDCADRRDANRTRDWAYSHAIIAAPRAAIGTPVKNAVNAAAGDLNELERQHSAPRTQQTPAPATTHQPRENAVPRDQHPDQLAPIDAGRQEQAVVGAPLRGIAAILGGAGTPAARDGQALMRPADVQVEHRTLVPGIRPTPDHWVSRQKLTPEHREARMAALELEMAIHALDMRIYENWMRLSRHQHGYWRN